MWLSGYQICRISVVHLARAHLLIHESDLDAMNFHSCGHSWSFFWLVLKPKSEFVDSQAEPRIDCVDETGKTVCCVVSIKDVTTFFFWDLIEHTSSHVIRIKVHQHALNHGVHWNQIFNEFFMKFCAYMFLDHPISQHQHFWMWVASPLWPFSLDLSWVASTGFQFLSFPRTHQLVVLARCIVLILN